MQVVQSAKMSEQFGRTQLRSDRSLKYTAVKQCFMLSQDTDDAYDSVIACF